MMWPERSARHPVSTAHLEDIMQEKLVSSDDGKRMWVLVLAPGEEAKSTIVDFAKRNNLKAASFVALGAFERAKLGYFDWQKKEYLPIPVEEQVEVSRWWATSRRMTSMNPISTAMPCWGGATAAPAAAICWKAWCARPWK
jgi:hypothetical protein